MEVLQYQPSDILNFLNLGFIYFCGKSRNYNIVNIHIIGEDIFLVGIEDDVTTAVVIVGGFSEILNHLLNIIENK